jgi:transcriptional regulator with XRE-family HTH domain
MAKQVIPTPMPSSSVITDPQILGKLIKAKRTALKMKLSDCASLCGVGINTLSRIENGNPNSTLAAVFTILNGLGIKLTSNELSADPNQDQHWV